MSNQKIDAKFYDKGYYDNMRGEGALIADAVRFSAVRDFLGGSKGPVLDVGCGRGEVVSLLQKSGVNAHGIDYSPHAKALAICPNIEQADATSLPFGDNYFEVAATFHTMEHLSPDRTKVAFSEMARVSSKGVLVVVPGLTPMATRKPQPDHQHEPTFDGWYKLARLGMPSFRMSHAKIYEPTYWVDAYEIWMWFVPDVEEHRDDRPRRQEDINAGDKPKG